MADGDAPPPRTELRLALVMSGGVSLCVWMGGASYEIDRLRRGDGVYGALAELTGVQPVVDIVSGTSAGGLNGVLLAAATAWRSTLDSLHDTWLRVADFGQLLRPANEKAPPSLLEGETFFVPNVTRALERISQASTGTPTEPLPRVHAIVTTTLMDPALRRYVDALHNRFAATTHLGLFRFSQGAPTDRDDYATRSSDRSVAIARLARAARSSASFPFAFEPSFVHVDPSDPAAAAGPIGPDGPNMAWIADFEASRYVMDGGLMDNEPIDQVLDLVADQPAGTPVRRVVVFVSPLAEDRAIGASDPDRADTAVRAAAMPGLVGVTSTTLMAPRESRVVAALDALKRRDQQASTIQQARAALYDGEDAAETVTAALMTRAASLHVAAGQLAEALALIRRNDVGEIARHPEAPWALDLVLARQNLLTTQDLLRRAALLLADPTDVIARRREVSDALANVRETSKVMTWAVAAEPDPNAVLGAPPASADAMPAAQPRTEAARTIAAAALTQLVDVLGVRSGTEPTRASGASSTDLAVLRREVATLTALALVAAGAPTDPPPPADASPTSETATPTSEAWWRALGDLDALQSVVTDGRTHNPQNVDLLVLSAATRSVLGPTRPPSEKLTGVQLMHFGAFYQSSWRQNDWIWGRLDGSYQLISLLADPDALLARHGVDGFGEVAARLASSLRDPALTAPLNGALGDWYAARGRALDAASTDREPAARAEEAEARVAFQRILIRAQHTDTLRVELPRLREELAANLDRNANDASAYLDTIASIDRHLARPFDAALLEAAWSSCELATKATLPGEFGSDRFAQVTTQTAAVTLNFVAGPKQPPPIGGIVRVLRGILRFAHFLTTPAASSGPVTWIVGAMVFAVSLLAVMWTAGAVGPWWLVPAGAVWLSVAFVALLRRRPWLLGCALFLLAVALACGGIADWRNELLWIAGGAFAAAAASVVAGLAVDADRGKPAAAEAGAKPAPGAGAGPGAPGDGATQAAPGS